MSNEDVIKQENTTELNNNNSDLETKQSKTNKKSNCPLACMAKKKTKKGKDSTVPKVKEKQVLDISPPIYRSENERGRARVISDPIDSSYAVIQMDDDVLGSDAESVGIVEEVIQSSHTTGAEGARAIVDVESDYDTIKKSDKPEQKYPDVPPKQFSHYPIKEAQGISTPRSVKFETPHSPSKSMQNSSNFGSTGDSVGFTKLMEEDVCDEVIEAEKHKVSSPMPSSRSVHSRGVTTTARSSEFDSNRWTPTPTNRSAETDFSAASSQAADAESYKKTIQKLYAELSRLLAPGSPRNYADNMKLMPGKGPVPPWLTDMHVIAPLYSELENQLKDSVRQLEATKRQLADLESRSLEIVKENELLRKKVRSGGSARASTAGENGHSHPEWDKFVDQGKLILEENQLLLRHLNVLQDKARIADRTHSVETTRYEQRVADLEATNAELETEADRLRNLLMESKRKCNILSQEVSEQDVRADGKMSVVTRELQQARETHRLDLADLNRKIEILQRECAGMSENLLDARSEKDRLEAKVFGLSKSLKDVHKKNLLLQNDVKKTASLQQYLDVVISTAKQIESERDAFKKTLESQETEYNKVMRHLMDQLKLVKSSSKTKDGNTLVYDDYNNSYGEPLLQADGDIMKMEKLVQRLLSVLKENEGKRDELEKEVRYLRSLLKEKSVAIEEMQSERSKIEEQLDGFWQAAAED